jgi:multiple sugar transport system substrate-binding protein
MLPLHLLVVAAMMLAAGCGSSQSDSHASPAGTDEEKAAVEPVKLSLFLGGGQLSDDEFQNYFVKPVEQKFPNITMEFVKRGKGTEITDLVAAGNVPDIIFTPQASMGQFIDLNLHMDVRDLMKKYKVSTDIFNPLTIDGIQSYSNQGEIYGLPLSYNFSALFYNKDIFDKFGVPYPKDKSTWDQIIELAKKVGRQDGEVQYEGLFAGSLWQFSQGLSAGYTDPKTDVPLFNTDKWKTAAQYYKRIYEIPGNRKAAFAHFFGSRNLAMNANVGSQMVEEDEKARTSGAPLNWDIASYPNIPEAVGKSMKMASQVLMPTSAGKHQDQAFQVLALVTGQEQQLKMSRMGRTSSLKDPAIRDQFGADSVALQGKHIESIFKNTPTPSIYEKYDLPARNLVDKQTPKLISGAEDVNTFLRNLQQLAVQMVQEEKAK